MSGRLGRSRGQRHSAKLSRRTTLVWTCFVIPDICCSWALHSIIVVLLKPLVLWKATKARAFSDLLSSRGSSCLLYTHLYNYICRTRPAWCGQFISLQLFWFAIAIVYLDKEIQSGNIIGQISILHWFLVRISKYLLKEPTLQLLQ